MQYQARLLGFMISRNLYDNDVQERTAFRSMTLEAARLGMQLCLFTFASVSILEQRIQALFYNAKKQAWEQRITYFPEIIFDRSFVVSKEEQLLHRKLIQTFRKLDIPVYGSALQSKWSVYSHLRQSSSINKLLPQTFQLRHIKQIQQWLSDHNNAFIKPEAGSKGKGTIQIIKQKHDLYKLTLRNKYNQLITIEQAKLDDISQVIEPLLHKCKYLLQPNLELTCSEGRAYDIRALVQKDAGGKWTLTGMAVRQGQPGSATSNLHGGGTAKEVFPSLQEQLGLHKAAQCYEQLKLSIRMIPLVIEEAFGRFYELGIDFGVDRQGALWFLEVNSKPGHSIFSKLGDHNKRSMSLRKPLLYARYLMERRNTITGHASHTFRRVT